MYKTKCKLQKNYNTDVPENSILYIQKSSEFPIKALLVGLSRDLHYSRNHIGKEYNLVLAAGGFWTHGNEC